MKTGPGDEAQPAGLEDAGARDVARQQVGRALDAGGGEVEGPGHGPCEQRLAGARDVLDEDMAVREQRDEHEPERLVDPDDGLADLPPQVIPELSPRPGLARGGPNLWRCRDHPVELGVHAQFVAASRRRTAGRIPPCSK